MKLDDIYPQIAQVARGYQFKKPPDFLIMLQTWNEKFWRLLHDFLSSLRITIPGLSDSHLASNILGMILGLAGLICFVFLFYFVWKRIELLNSQAQFSRKAETMTGELSDSLSWRAEADRLAQAQSWREACRAIYCAVLRLLEEREILDFSLSRSNYEYWYALAKSPKIQNFFKTLVNTVEIVWFGNKSAQREDYEDCCQQFNNIAEQLSTEEGKAANSWVNP